MTMPPHRKRPVVGSPAGAEDARLATGDRRRSGRWKHWGPYLSERAWGTVREDYSPDGTAWDSFPHDHARSRAYRWNEDGLAGICDLRQHLCFSLALWNGVDPILKERLFGLTGPEGNHGEDVKECWWYVDSTPTHSWMRWRYLYPQRSFPYQQLVEENRRRGRDDPEFELADTGALDDGRFWAVTVDYAKASPDDLCIAVDVHNCGPEPARLDVLGQLWFRNTWSWGRRNGRPQLWATAEGELLAEHSELGRYRLVAEDGPGGPADLLCCDNETNTARLWGVAGPAYPKDAINDHVVHGDAAVSPERRGTKGAARHTVTVAPGDHEVLRFRLTYLSDDPSVILDEPFDDSFAATMRARRDEADEFYAGVLDGLADDDARIARQALAGVLWSKQFYHFDVEHWLDGDPGQPAPPPHRAGGRNERWRHLDSFDVLSMPDKWEYPWFAAWDLAFHCVSLARVDPELAKHQLTLLGREWFMHPNGQLPAYEWSFDDVNPPVHAWAARRVFELDGSWDHPFLESMFHKLLLNFTWWVNREDAEGNNVFEGGFLGLDNIGPFDRSHGPTSGRLEQTDGTAWMAMYCLDLLEIALILADHDDAYEDVTTKFVEHFAYIATALNTQGLWDESLQFYRDVFRSFDGPQLPIPAVSMVGLVPLFAVTLLPAELRRAHRDFAFRLAWFAEHKPDYAAALATASPADPDAGGMLSLLTPQRLAVVLRTVLDERELLSPFGLRSLSRRHLDHPVELVIDDLHYRLDYEPAESRTGQFGGNSNWRGPVWFPLNFLAIEALRRFHTHLGDGYTVECPTGSGRLCSLEGVADELSRRLIALFQPDGAGQRPALVIPPALRADPQWSTLLQFHEYFDGDRGVGLGASHQTGWTALVAELLLSGRSPGREAES